jgi:hypothetical protein
MTGPRISFSLTRSIAHGLLLMAFQAWIPALPLPVTGHLSGVDTPYPADPAQTGISLPSLAGWSQELLNGNRNQLVGVFAPGAFAQRIVPQTPGSPGHVTWLPEAVTRFGLADRFGSVGLLAHNTLAGEGFFRLAPGDPVMLIYGDGGLARFRVTAVERYQALSPLSPYSQFLDLDVPGRQLSSTSLFYYIYDPDGRLILQTCITRDGQDAWGRLFVIAVPEPETTGAAPPLPLRSRYLPIDIAG